VDKNSKFNMADTGGRRNERSLTPEQFQEAKDYAILIGMPDANIRYSERSLTSYLGGGIDVLTIGTDVLPMGGRTQNPNDNISLKGAVAHEIVGHREADLKGRSISENEPLDEAQASIRAARFAPNLHCNERGDLLRDAIMRLKNAGTYIRAVKNQLFINER